MARKGADGIKHSKKNNAKDNKKFNVYNQKSVRIQEALAEKRKSQSDGKSSDKKK